MSNITFPIAKVIGNRLLAIDGRRSAFFKIIPPDITQLSNSERNGFFNGVLTWLNFLDEDSTIKLYCLDGNAYLDTCSDHLPDSHALRTIPQENPLETFFGFNDIISDVCIYDDYLNFNGAYVSILSVIDFPEGEINENFLPHGVDYVLNIKKISKEKSISKMESIRTSHLSSFSKTKKDISGESTYSQAEDLLDDIIHGQEALFEIELFFLVKATSTDELNTKTTNLYNELNTRGIKTFIEGQSLEKKKTGLAAIFTELIPGVTPRQNLRTHITKSNHLKFLLPLRRSFLMSEGVTFSDQLGDEIYFNPFKKEIKNKNMLVTGTTGAGKSVFVNKLVNFFIKDHPTVILDKGGSFKRLTMYHGGEVLESGFNPLQFKDPQYLREIILSIVDLDKFSKLDQGKLLKSIKKALPKSDNFKQMLELLEKDFKGISLYFEDIKDYLTDNIIEDKPILYVDVENYPKSIIAPLIIFLLEYFKNLKAGEKILVFDECWSFLKEHAGYIDECFRTFRKSGAFPIAISQSLKDFEGLGGDLYSSITNNCYFKVFFPQDIRGSDLDSFDEENIKSLNFSKGNFSDCYLKSSDNRYRKILRNYLTNLEYELFQTEAGDTALINFIKKFGEYFNSKAEVIDSFVKLKTGGGLNDYDFDNNV